MKPNEITVQTKITAPIKKVWDHLTAPSHIIHWNHAIDAWHCPKAESDLKAGGTFNYRMQAKDGSVGFDFTGTFDAVEAPNRLAYTLDDGRKVEVTLTEANGHTTITEVFEAEPSNPIEMQREGWQAILNNLGSYVESSDK